MRILLWLSTLLILTLTILTGVIGYYFYENPRSVTSNKEQKIIHEYSNYTDFSLERKNILNVKSDPKDLNDLYTSGWIPDWDIPDGLTTVKNNSGKFQSLSPVWFYPNEDGSLKITPYANGPQLLEHVKENNIELIPTISLFDTELMHGVLSSKENINRHIEQILDQIVTNGYDGIDLDYESIYLEDKQEFFYLLQELSNRLDKIDKKLVVTVMPKWGDSFYYENMGPQTRLVQDYKKIADISDEFRIMTYEFTGRSATLIGPIAPLEWMEFVLQYTISEGVPRDKIMLGIHNYAYDYPEREIMSSIKDGEKFKLGKFGDVLPGQAIFFKSMDELFNDYDLKTEFNNEWGEAIGRYVYEGENRVVIYPNNDSIRLRKELAAKYGIKRVVYWRLGDEGNLRY